MDEIINVYSKEVCMPTPFPSNKPRTQQTAPAELDERIRRRAYELYEQRNRTDGRDMDDWLQAEAEVNGKKTRITTM